MLGAMNVQRCVTSTTFSGTLRSVASLDTASFTSESSVAAMAMNAPSRSPCA